MFCLKAGFEPTKFEQENFTSIQRLKHKSRKRLKRLITKEGLEGHAIRQQICDRTELKLLENLRLFLGSLSKIVRSKKLSFLGLSTK